MLHRSGQGRDCLSTSATGEYGTHEALDSVARRDLSKACRLDNDARLHRAEPVLFLEPRCQNGKIEEHRSCHSGLATDSYAEGRFVNSCDYDLAALCAHAAPLRGCVIAFTSSYPRSRGVPGFKLVEEHIVNLGGICDQASEPIHTLTHLCATEEEIRHQGIYVKNVLHRAKSDEDKAFHLVNHQWLVECLRQGRRVEEDLDVLPLSW